VHRIETGRTRQSKKAFVRRVILSTLYTLLEKKKLYVTSHETKQYKKTMQTNGNGVSVMFCKKR
jgi:uncharacterized pyridoxamine 5'-phosphate oxidase family protein